MRYLWILPVVLVCAGLLVLGFGCLLAVYSTRIKRQTLAEARAWQEEHYDLSWYDPLQKEDYLLRCRDGYQLHVQHLCNPNPSNRAVIISHGLTDNRYGALKYAKPYLDMGFDVIIYDLRGHGENKKTWCSYSLRESRDLNLLIRDTRDRFPDLKVLGLHGESLGAATSVAVLRYSPKVDFVVSDCAFSEVKSILTAGLKSMHLPEKCILLSGFCTRLLYGVSYDEMRPIDRLKKATQPILFIHGAADELIPPSHAEDMHAAVEDHSELHLVDGAPHALSVLTAPEDYRRWLRGFLRDYDLL